MNRIIHAVAALAMVCIGSGCAHTPRIVTDPAWTDLLTPLNEPYGLHGADGAASVDLPNGRTLWLFADSWVGKIAQGGYAPGATIVNNAIAWHPTPKPGAHPAAPSVEVDYGPSPRPGQPSAWLVPQDGPNPFGAEWCWPTGGAAVVRVDGTDRLVIFFNDMARKRAVSADDVWNFRGVGNRAAVIENPREDPRRWRVRQFALGPRRAGERQISWGVAVVPESETSGAGLPSTMLVYGVDTTDGTNKKAVVARAWESELHHFEAWRFWDGSGWSGDESAAAAVVENVVDEFSVERLTAGRDGARYVMVHGEGMLGTGVFARTASTPRGPWSEAAEVYRASEPKADERLIVYGAKGHAPLSSPGELLISYCVNTQDFKQMVSDAGIYRPRFVRVRLKD